MVRLPTRSADWRLVGRTLRLVLGVPAYALLGVVAAVAALSAFSLSQNLDLVTFAVTSGRSVGDKLDIVLGLYPFLGTSYGTLTGLAIVVVAGLTGANVALVAYHLREHDLSARGGSGSLLGVVLGVLGAGCAACGGAILAGVLSLVGAGGLVTALPMEGRGLSLLAAVVLLLSTFWLADGMRGGEIRGCPVEPPG